MAAQLQRKPLFAIAALVVCTMCVAATGFGEVITNGGFETGDLTGWETFRALDGSGGSPGVRESGYSGQPPQEGNYLLEIYENSSNMNGDGAGIHQEVVVPLGRELVLSYFQNSVNNRTFVTASLIDENGLLLAALEESADSGEWLPRTVSFTATTRRITVRFKETSDNSSSRDPLLDGIHLTPEPAGMVFLLLAGLLILRRRP